MSSIMTGIRSGSPASDLRLYTSTGIVSAGLCGGGGGECVGGGGGGGEDGSCSETVKIFLRRAGWRVFEALYLYFLCLPSDQENFGLPRETSNFQLPPLSTTRRMRRSTSSYSSLLSSRTESTWSELLTSDFF